MWIEEEVTDTDSAGNDEKDPATYQNISRREAPGVFRDEHFMEASTPAIHPTARHMEAPPTLPVQSTSPSSTDPLPVFAQGAVEELELGKRRPTETLGN